MPWFASSGTRESRPRVYFVARTETDAHDLYLSEMGERPSVLVEEAHDTVGKTFRGLDGISVCTGYDSRQGFWMLWPSGETRNVSERAIGRTFHRVREIE